MGSEGIMADCARCQARGKPEHFGSDPECAFPDGVFSPSNWQCATMNEIRDAVEEADNYQSLGSLRLNDQSAGLLGDEASGQYIVLSWYKSRGRTEGAWLMSESHIEPLKLEDAERVLADP